MKRKRTDGWPEWREWLFDTPFYRERKLCSGLMLKGRWKWAQPLVMVWLCPHEDTFVAVLANGYEETYIPLDAVRSRKGAACSYRGRAQVGRGPSEPLRYLRDGTTAVLAMEAGHRAFREREEGRLRAFMA